MALAVSVLVVACRVAQRSGRHRAARSGQVGGSEGDAAGVRFDPGPERLHHRLPRRSPGRTARQAALRRLPGPGGHRHRSLLGDHLPHDRRRRAVPAAGRRGVAGVAGGRHRAWLRIRAHQLPGGRGQRLLLPGGRLHRLRRHRVVPRPRHALRAVHRGDRAGPRVGACHPDPPGLLAPGGDRRAAGRLLQRRLDGPHPRRRHTRPAPGRPRPAARRHRHPGVPRRTGHLGGG